TLLLALMLIDCPVAGFLPLRAPRSDTVKLPKPGTFAASPDLSVWAIAAKPASKASAACRRVSPSTESARLLTKSALPAISPPSPLVFQPKVNRETIRQRPGPVNTTSGRGTLIYWLLRALTSTLTEKPSWSPAVRRRQSPSPATAALAGASRTFSSGAGAKSGWAARKRAATCSFSSSSREQVIATRGPPGATRGGAAARSLSADCASRPISPSLIRHLSSGWRRRVPVPVQGRSSTTRSKVPANGGAPASAARTGSRRPRRLRLARTSPRRAGETSESVNRTLGSQARSEKLLPPGAAAASQTVSPGTGGGMRAAAWLASSWTQEAAAAEQ